jgi:hypothetical protein
MVYDSPAGPFHITNFQIVQHFAFVRSRRGSKEKSYWEDPNKFAPHQFSSIPTSLILLHFFVYFFGGLECVGHSFAYVCRVVCILEGCLDSNPESCRSKHARYLLSQLST